MSNFEHIEDTAIPSWAMSYLENGDASGLEAGDEEVIQEWLYTRFPDHHSLVFDWIETNGEYAPHFTPFPVFGLATDCCDVSIWGHRDEL